MYFLSVVNLLRDEFTIATTKLVYSLKRNCISNRERIEQEATMKFHHVVYHDIHLSSHDVQNWYILFKNGKFDFNFWFKIIFINVKT